MKCIFFGSNVFGEITTSMKKEITSIFRVSKKILTFSKNDFLGNQETVTYMAQRRTKKTHMYWHNYFGRRIYLHVCTLVKFVDRPVILKFEEKKHIENERTTWCNTPRRPKCASPEEMSRSGHYEERKKPCRRTKNSTRRQEKKVETAVNREEQIQQQFTLTLSEYLLSCALESFSIREKTERKHE